MDNQTAPAPVSAADFKAQNPALAQVIDIAVGGIIQQVEKDRPELKGEAKKEAALTEFEKFLINLKDNINKYVVEFPPLVNLALDTALPYASDVIEAGCNLFKAGGLFGPKATEGEASTDVNEG